MKKKEIADQFAKDHGLMVSYCSSCQDWFVRCPYCNTLICCYVKFCCYAAAKNYQPKLDKLMEAADENL